MSDTQPLLARLRAPSDGATSDAASSQFSPKIAHTPDLPAINWASVKRSAPQLLNTPTSLPPAAVIVISWTDAEWAALEHVFCAGNSAMKYSARTDDNWSGWQRYTTEIPTVKEWTYWGEYRLVQVGASPILLFKSNTHLDFPGQQYLEQMLQQLILAVKPKLILSTGTAGGARPSDRVGTVTVTNAGTVYESKLPQSQWPTFKTAWEPNWSIAGSSPFAELVMPVPTTLADLTSVCGQFNAFYESTYTLIQLNVDGLDMAGAAPAIDNLTAAGVALLSTDSFVVGNQNGNLVGFACVEMDDAILAKVCSGAGVLFGSVRNISDPVQNSALPQKVQAHWAQTIYDAYGFYTSYNSALTTWAVLAA